MSIDRRYLFERLLENFYALDETFQEQELPSLFDDVSPDDVALENPEDVYVYDTLRQILNIIRSETD
jgi:hypothetical protein